MGKKKASRAGGSEFGGGGDERASSTGSVCGRSAATDLAELYSDEEENEFEVGCDMMMEKRGSTREAGLQKVVRLMTTEWQFEECTFKQETLFRLSLNCFKRGSAIESALAAKALALHVLTLGLTSFSEEVFQDALTAMQPVIVKATKAAEVRVAAVDALSMMCFLAAEGPEETLEVMHLLKKTFGKATSEVQAAALRGWTLLFTTVPAWKLGGTSFVEDHLKIFAALLHTDNVDVRAAAGEAVTVVYDACDLSSLPESHSANDDGGGEGGAADVDGDERAFTALTLERIVERMADLAKNKGDDTRRSKKDRVVLRTTFRELSNILEGGPAPVQKVKLRHGDMLVVDTLTGNVQLNAFREFLGEGFQTHLLQNPFLHDVFEFSPSAEPADRLSAVEKRYNNSVQGKERAQMRKQERRMSAAFKDMTLLH